VFDWGRRINQDLSNWDVSSVTEMSDMFLDADALSEINKCAIHTSFSTNNAWPYDWTDCYQFQTTAALQTAVDLWVSDSASAVAAYGDINTWDVSLITDMNCVFCNAYTFNDDISNWDVSNAVYMDRMFYSTTFNNQNINNWNVSNVLNMHRMFYNSNFNQPLNKWNVSNVNILIIKSCRIKHSIHINGIRNIPIRYIVIESIFITK
jgi:hypothetical protein